MVLVSCLKIRILNDNYHADFLMNKLTLLRCKTINFMENRSTNRKVQSLAHEIDESHNKLNEIRNFIKSLTKTSVTKSDLMEVFFMLSNFYEDHIIKEELYLKNIGYPNIVSHQNSHQDFIRNIENLKDNYKNDVKHVLMDLDHFIENWLTQHSINYGQDVVRYLKLKG